MGSVGSGLKNRNLCALCGNSLMRFCVFCGSSFGVREEYRQAAVTLGECLLERDIGLVYGGGSVGLMGAVADTVMAGGGQVVGVIPESMARREVAHHGLTQLEVVQGMHPRKARMAELSAAFIALPGGFGTFEELFEVITWSQLGFHAKPIGLLNVLGYFNPFLELVDHALQEGFIRPDNRALFEVEDSPEELLERLRKRLPADELHGIDLKEI